jgi:hypothetical protein
MSDEELRKKLEEIRREASNKGNGFIIVLLILLCMGACGR